MNIVKLIIAVAIAAGAYQYWHKHQRSSAATSGHSSSDSANAADSQNGFVALPAMNGADTSTVLVIAAENCPEEAGQRADRLAEQLSSSGIPVSRIHQASFNISNSDPSEVQRINSVMEGELPIVFVRGRAKSNPSLAEVTAEYRGTSN